MQARATACLHPVISLTIHYNEYTLITAIDQSTYESTCIQGVSCIVNCASMPSTRVSQPTIVLPNFTRTSTLTMFHVV
jgi:hypothetical protein